MEWTVTEAEKLKNKPDESKLGFGTLFTDHMFNMDYTPDKGWHSARIEPYAPFSLEPSTMFLHYARAPSRDSRHTEPTREISSFSGPRKISNA
jgi:branched-chain amino acid aminotransferase